MVVVSDIVVQTWNIRDIDESIIANTEFIINVGNSNVDDVLRLWSHPITGISVPDDILLRTGSPICNESDTRISYMKGENPCLIVFIPKCPLLTNPSSQR